MMMNRTPQDRSADGVPEFAQEVSPGLHRESLAEVLQQRGRAFREIADETMWSANTPMPHPMENCGPLRLKLNRGESCPTCGTVPANTPAEARTGRSDRVAAALNELAALRQYLLDHQMGYGKILVRLNRAVELLKAEGGAVPQRATAYGLELWQHACGVVDHAGPEQPHPDQCDTCRYFRPLTSDPWHPLYVLTDGAA